MKKLSILVSTVDLNFEQNKTFAENINFELCEVIVVQQLIHSDEILQLDFEAKILSVKEKGLAKSRNRAWSLATCPVALICDDDIQFIKGFEQTILSAYDKYPDAGLISFQIRDEKGRPYKSYPPNSGKHSFRSILRVNSIETTIQKAKFKSEAPYDERFGLGANCPTGEDTIFAVDTFKSSVPCYYVATPIVLHPLESSGKTFNRDYPFFRGQVYARAFGLLGIFLGFLFAVKKYPLYRAELGFFRFVYAFVRGFFIKPR